MDIALPVLVVGALLTTAGRVAATQEQMKRKRRRERQHGAQHSTEYDGQSCQTQVRALEPLFQQVRPQLQADPCVPLATLPSRPRTVSLAEHLALGKGATVPSLNTLQEAEAPANNPLPPRDYVF
jgi:hypothetical protein